MDIVERTGDVLDTGIKGDTDTTHILDGLADDLQVEAAADAVGESLGERQVDVHQVRFEGTEGTGVRVLSGSDRNLTDAERHEREAQHARLTHAGQEAERGDTGVVAHAHQPTGVAEVQIQSVARADASHIAVDGFDTMYERHACIAPT